MHSNAKKWWVVTENSKIGLLKECLENLIQSSWNNSDEWD